MMRKSGFEAILLLGLPGAGKSPFGDFLERQEISGRRLWHFDFGRELRAILENYRSSRREYSPEAKAGPGNSYEKKHTGISASEFSSEPPNSNFSEKLFPVEDLSRLKNFPSVKKSLRVEDSSLSGYFNSKEIGRIRQSVDKATLFEEEDKELVQKIFRYFLEKNRIQLNDILILNGLPRHPGQVAWLSGMVEIKFAVHLMCSEETAIRRILSDLDGERSGRGDDTLEIIRKRYQIYRRRTMPLLAHLRQTEIPLVELSVDEETRVHNLWSLLHQSEDFRKIFF
jgi:adenylate kinase family enzyme